MIKTGSLLRLTMVLGLALGTSACSSLSSLDPTGLFGDDSVPDSQFPDAGAPQASDATVGTTPDLASLPDRPATINTAQRQQTAQSLAADGAQVQYSADALRGGTEAAAPAPGAAGPAIVPVAAPPPPAAAPAPVLADNDAPPTADSAPPSASNDFPPSAQPSPARVAANPNAAVPAVPTTSSAPARGARVASVAPPLATRTPANDPPAAANDAPPTASDAPPTAEAPRAAAPVAAASGGEPAVPSNTPARGGAVRLASNQGVSDTELGFKPSSAPPLSPSINQWVAAPIIDRYRQTASNAGITTPTGQAAVPAVGASATDRSVTTGANGAAPAAVVYFAGDGIKLSAAARKEIRTAAQLFKASGGSATVRVIGHSSSRTANMSVEKHLETIFDKSQKRANAVAQELIHEGVPATRVLVEAVGDSQPVYYESMPQGEAGNRRAEIFVQS